MDTYKGTALDSYRGDRTAAYDGMTIEEADEIFEEYYRTIDFSEEYFAEEYQKLVTDALKYAAMRAEWACMGREQKIAEDSRRTSLHNTFLNDVARYAGYLKRNGLDVHWFEMLGQEIEPEEINFRRKRIGDWACYIALFVSLQAR